MQAPAATFHIEDTTASTGVTSLLIKAGGGQATNSLMSWQNSAGATLGLINQVGTVVAPAFTNGPQNFILGSLSTQYSSGYVLSFGPNATAGSSDTGISRNGVGLIEINSGTAGQYRDITYRIAQWRNGTEATCDATTRGQVVMVQGGAGVADTLRVCAKDAADAYAWTALY